MLAALLALCLVPAGALAHAEIDDVVRALDQEAALHATDPTVALQLSAARRIAGDFDGALEAAAHAEAHGASPREVTLARADVFMAAGWLRSARRHLERVLDADPDDADARFRRARVLMRQGEPAAAARDYARALAAAPHPRPGHFMEHRDALVAAGDPDGALAALDAGVARLGPIVSLQIPAAVLALDLGRPDDAIGRIDGLLARTPDNPLLLARKAEVLMRSGRTDDARRVYRDALERLERRSSMRRSERATMLEREIRTTLAENAPGTTEDTR